MPTDSTLLRGDVIPIADAKGFGLLELGSHSGLTAQLLPTGALFALRHRQTLINQLLPGPAEDGLFRLLVRWWTSETGDWRPTGGWAAVAGPGLVFGRVAPRAVAWTAEIAETLTATTTFEVHPKIASWTWRVRVRNTSTSALHVDVLHALDLGLADEGAVRNNEAYVSQYIDLLPVFTPALGWVILARQNQPMTGGMHPWLAVGCGSGAEAFCTDGWQFFGADHRVTGEPDAVRVPALPSRRLQYEFALAGLQSRSAELGPGATAEVTFVGGYLDDHPSASAPEDVNRLVEILASRG